MSNAALTTTGPEPDARYGAALEKLKGLLIPEERLEAVAVQRRLFALFHRRILVACTSGRLLVLRRKLLPGFDMVDVRWQDVRDARLTEGIFGSTLSVGTQAGAQVITGLRKEQAEAVYRICQAQEQSWREKNRVREMEEMRARAGGVQINAPAPQGSAAAAEEAPQARLQRAKQMLDQGLITDAEYEAVKAKILSSI